MPGAASQRGSDGWSGAARGTTLTCCCRAPERRTPRSGCVFRPAAPAATDAASRPFPPSAPFPSPPCLPAATATSSSPSFWRPFSLTRLLPLCGKPQPTACLRPRRVPSLFRVYNFDRPFFSRKSYQHQADFTMLCRSVAVPLTHPTFFFPRRGSVWPGSRREQLRLRAWRRVPCLERALSLTRPGWLGLGHGIGLGLGRPRVGCRSNNTWPPTNSKKRTASFLATR
ncbi:hypothetical protein IWZ03DRAFT_385041 [Phyllosticta citriasiana]|uniref:Uncharacterized protein n=1 Tax=Phyllosticta citriasiana TaxID=595635 RepID=A0ABR1KGJ2_9PEZI